MSAPPLIHYKVDATNSGKSFVFTVLKCTDLPDADGLWNKSDAYVRVKVAGQEEQKTPTISGELNPIYEKDNNFVFQGGVGTVVELAAMDWDPLNYDDILVQASVTLTADKLSGAPQSTRLMVVDMKGGFTMTSSTIGDNSVAGDNARGHAASGQLTLTDSKIGDNTVAGDNARGHGAGGQSAPQTSGRGHIAIDHCGRLTMITSNIGSNTVAGDNARGHSASGKLTMSDSTIGDGTVAGDNAQGHGASGQLSMAGSNIGSNTVAGDNARGHAGAQNAPIKVGEWAVDACGKLTLSNSTIGDGTVAGDNAQGHGASGQLTMAGSTIGSNTVAGDNARGHAGAQNAPLKSVGGSFGVDSCGRLHMAASGNLTMSDSTIGDGTVAGDNAQGHGASGQLTMSGSTIGSNTVAGDNARGHAGGAVAEITIKREPRDVSKCLTMSNSKIGDNTVAGDNAVGHANAGADSETVDVIEVTRIRRAPKDACGQLKMGESSIGTESVAGDGAIGSGVGANGVVLYNSKIGLGSTIGNNARGHNVGNVSGDCKTQ